MGAKGQELETYLIAIHSNLNATTKGGERVAGDATEAAKGATMAKALSLAVANTSVEASNASIALAGTSKSYGFSTHGGTGGKRGKQTGTRVKAAPVKPAHSQVQSSPLRRTSRASSPVLTNPKANKGAPTKGVALSFLGHANCPPPWHTFARFYTQNEQCKKIPFFERYFRGR